MILRTWAGALRTRILRVWDLRVSGTCGRQDSAGSRSQEMHKLGLGNIRLRRLESKKSGMVRKFQGTSDLSLWHGGTKVLGQGQSQYCVGLSSEFGGSMAP